MMSFLPILIYRVNAIPFKSKKAFIVEIYKLILKFINKGDFPGGPLVGTLPSGAGGVGSIPGPGAKIPHPGAKIPHASWPKNQGIEQRQYCNKFYKDFKNGPHQKKNL